MTEFLEKHRKTLFYLILIGCVITIGIYNFLTPYFTDDYGYAQEARSAGSLWGLIKQQYIEYMYHNARIIGQFNLRLFLIPGKWLFNIVNSLMFTGLVLLIYAMIHGKKKYDLFVLFLVITFVWRYSVRFGETTLWLCGTCNYLWGMVIIMGFLVWYRHMLFRDKPVQHPLGTVIGGFLFGLAAGWCNENTSGGAFLLTLFFTIVVVWIQKNKKFQLFMAASLLGVFTGVMGMALCPGVRYRIDQTEGENFTGFIGLISRLYKITVTVKGLFTELVILLVIALVIWMLQKRRDDWKEICGNYSVLFAVAALATSYALILIPPTTARAHYGAGIFLVIACIQAIVQLDRKDLFVKTLQYSLAVILCLWFLTTYSENMVNLWRINREDQERIELILEAKQQYGGDAEVIVPQLRPQFENSYSTAHDSDLTEDKDHWINMFYESYYGVKSVIAIPREEWEEQFGKENG